MIAGCRNRLNYAPQLRPVNPGDRFFLPLLINDAGERIHGHNISVTESVDCTVEDVTIYTARSGMNYLLSRNEGRITLRNTRIDFKPGSQHICTTWRDGVHCKDNRVGPLIEGCYYEGMLDDSINISANTAMASEIISEQEFVLTGPRFDVGNDVMVFDPVSGEIIAHSKVVAVKAIGRDWRVELKSPVKGVIAGTKRAALDVKSTHFYNMSYINDGLIVRNCTFKPQRRHALLVRSCNGVFENNIVDGVGGAAVRMSNELGSFYEGPFPFNNIIRNNKIKNTQTTAIQICTVSLNGDSKITRDIIVEGNTIVPLPGAFAVDVKRAENVVLLNNTFLDENGNARGQDAVNIQQSSNVEFSRK